MSIVSFRKHQSGISIIMAIVALLGLSLLGTMIVVLTSTQSESTVNEWFSAQALYAAESGIQAAAFNINQSAVFGAGVGNCAAGNTAVVALEAGRAAWYTVNTAVINVSGFNLCQITATGLAGGTSASPIAQRQITADYKSVVIVP